MFDSSGRREGRQSNAPLDWRLPLALWAVVLIAFVGAARLMLWYWPGSFFLAIRSDIWTALAWNFGHGEFYRAPVGPHGYGGTRYMPLLFVVHGLLIRADLDPVHTGAMLMQLSVAVAAVALYTALRASGLSVTLAVPLAGTIWATVLYQQAIGDLSPDYFAAAFGMAGAAIALGGRGSRPLIRTAGASLSCVIAGLTKVTAIAFVIPIVAWLWRDDRRRDAVQLALATALGFASALTLVQVASGGRFLDAFLPTMTAGMTTKEAWRTIPNFVWQITHKPFDVAVPLAASCWYSLKRAALRQSVWADAYLVAAALITVAIYATPGTVSNHLVDLQMASTLVIGVTLARGELSSKSAAWAYAALAVIVAAISWPLPYIPSVVATQRNDGPRPRIVVRAIHEEFLPSGTRYLSIDPIIPVLNNEPPFLLDFYNLERFVIEGAPAGRDIEQRVRDHFFQVIVLRDSRGDFPHDMNAGDPGFTKDCQQYWGDEGSPLIQLFRSAYEIRAVREPFVVLTPLVGTGPFEGGFPQRDVRRSAAAAAASSRS